MSDVRDATNAAPSAFARWRPWLRRGALGAAALGLLTAGWWGPPLLSTLDFFRVQRVEFEGLRYGDPAELVERLALDSTASVWMPLEPLALRVTGHPMITEAELSRRLPATLVVSVQERVPVALAPSGEGLRPVDAAGDTLPIDPAISPVDVPVVPAADSALLALLARIRSGAPALWMRLSAARPDGRDDVRLVLDDVVLRARRDVTVARLADILPVEADLARRRLQAVELDLRYRDQVIARLP